MPKRINPLFLTALAATLLVACGDKNQPTRYSENMPSEFDSELQPPTEITPVVFAKWRDARRGRQQAKSQSNPYWKWILETETSAYLANEHFGGPSSFGGNPVWEASRFGQSKTILPDGREILIAGEHEDYYDPDFFIYNDVIIRHPDGNIDFLGYPTDAFPPTDFHSATLLDDQIILIGNLGYDQDRLPNVTQLLALDIGTWQISKQPSTGDNPGWLHHHRTELSDDKKSILITGGIVNPADPELPMIENIDDWRLHLDDWRWERLTERKWPLFEISRSDDEPNQLWEMRQSEWEREFGKIDLAQAYKSIGQDIDAETVAILTEATDYPPPKDRLALERLYQPDKVVHQQIPERVLDEDDDDLSELGLTRIEVEGVIVRYKEESDSIQLTVEGELAKETIKALVADLVSKLSKVEGTEYQSKKIRG
ncbi:MAG: hypothetical protein ACI8XO_001430 [Verrucomicrobiales bacterium]|jgi:hypothetical protein